MSQVLALKYRPSSFDKLIGQDTITQTLTLALDQDRLSHAYLFSGLRGSGKTSTARIFAKALICDNGPTSSPCEVCQNCKEANRNSHIDITEMDAASSRKIDDIRSLIEQTKYKPNSARFKIFIIDEVHMLTKEAFNALLKTLEEPPEYVKFILATTDPMKLPPTILSRTQHFRFKKINAPEIVKHLSHILNLENIEYESEALSIITRSGNGSLRDTLTLLDQAIIFSKNFVDAKSVVSMLGVLDPEFIKNIFDGIFQNDREKLVTYIKELENYESEIVIDEIISYVKEKFFENNKRFSIKTSDKFFNILSQSKNLLTLNTDNSFVLTLLLFKMAESVKSIDISIHKEPIAQTLENLPKKQESMIKEEVKEVNKEPKNLDYQNLIDKLYDRNYELGECFKKSIEFISFEDNSLKLISCANEDCKKILRQSSAIIKHFVQESFGFDAKIVMQPCKEQKKNDIKPKDTAEIKPEIINDKPDSCATNKALNSTNEIDNILENKFVKKATELFDAKKIVVKSKV